MNEWGILAETWKLYESQMEMLEIKKHMISKMNYFNGLFNR